MAYRMEIKADTLVFVGCLDSAALGDLRARCRSSRCSRVVLGAGTLLSPESIPGLLALEVPVVAESSYLARWLDNARNAGGQS